MKTDQVTESDIQIGLYRMADNVLIGEYTCSEMNWQNHITADPGVMVGKPVIRGTRLTVDFILGLLAQGWPEDEITRNYGITAEQVRACVAYAQERLNEEKVFAPAK